MTHPTLVVIDPVTAGSRRPIAQRLRRHDPTVPVVRVDDAGITRGDGVFESLPVVHGHPHALDVHLARLQRSAAQLDLPELDLTAVDAAVWYAIELHEDSELLVKIVVTRGVDHNPTAWVHACAAPDYTSQQREGVRAVTLDRGYRADVARTSPWLLAGAKTLSYAIHTAALREAGRRGADEVIFVSTDGFVLEGPTSSVIARFGPVCATPATDQGILAGTTQITAREVFASHGYDTVERPIPRDTLDRCDGLWLVSSGRKAVPVVELDGRPLPVDRDLTDVLLRGLTDATHAASPLAVGSG